MTTRKCGTCGTPAIDEMSVFCNKCGNKLPAPNILTCKKCGKTFTDTNSSFCNRCGSSLIEDTVIVTPLSSGSGQTCPGCGFFNDGENPLYCRKCGSYLGIPEPEIQPDVTRLVKPVPFHKPENPSAIAKKESSERMRDQKLSSQKGKIAQGSFSGSYRRAITAGAVIIMVIIIIGIIAMVVPGILNTVPNNSTAIIPAGTTNPGSASVDNPPGDTTISQNTAPAAKKAENGATSTSAPEISRTLNNGQSAGSGVTPADVQTPGISETPAIVQPTGVVETPAIVQPTGVVETPAIVQPTGVVETPAIVQPTGVVETPATPAPSG